MCRPFFFLPITATLTIVVVEHVELDPSNNPAREGLRLPTYGPLTKKVAHPCLIICIIPGMANLFKWWVKFKIADRKNVGHGCNNINEGLERKFCRNLCKEQKKDLHLKNTKLPVFNAPV